MSSTKSHSKSQPKNQSKNNQPKSQPKNEQENEQPKPKNKIWKSVTTFNSYEEAAALKTKMLHDVEGASETVVPALEVKIARCGPGGTQFKVKAWSPVKIKKARKSNKTKT